MSSTTTTTKTSINTLNYTPFATNTPSEDEIPRGPVTADLIFYAPPLDNSAPFRYVEAPPPGQPQQNYTENPSATTIRDIRGHEDDFDINVHGFAAVQNISSKLQTITTASDAEIKETYYPEVESLILQHVDGAKRVFLFDHTIRRADPAANRQPVNRVHVDQTPASALQRVRHHLPSEADTLLQSRVRIINVWRPLNPSPVVSFPLAVADSSSVSDDAVVGVQHRYPDRVGETAGVKQAEGQRWWYWSGMTGDERLFLQCFDSEGTGARTPHTAFVDPRTKAEWPGRESIEVRALVFG